MSIDNQKQRLYKPPYSLPVQIKHAHQWYFQHFINEVAPKVREALKKLTPLCIELFGDFPASDGSEEKSHAASSKVSRIFGSCIWKESREIYNSFFWLPILSKNDEILEQIFKNESNIDNLFANIAKQKIESLTKAQVNSFKETFAPYLETLAPYFTNPIDSLDIKDLQFAYQQVLRDLLWTKDKNYVELINYQSAKLESLSKFQEEFDLLLKKFCLEKNWLALSVFEAIWNGTGLLQPKQRFIEVIPKEVISEINNRLGREEIIKPENNLENDYKILSELDIPLPDSFVYQEQNWIYEGFNEYEEDALKAYRQHVHNYLSIVKESFEKFGYKQPRRPYDYTRVKWLVQWNIECWTKDQILQEIANTTGKFFSLDMIDKAFRQLEKYDLPVRTQQKGNN